MSSEKEIDVYHSSYENLFLETKCKTCLGFDKRSFLSQQNFYKAKSSDINHHKIKNN